MGEMADFINDEMIEDSCFEVPRRRYSKMIEENLCPLCKSKMISRQNKETKQRFWGCSEFPKCKGTRNTDGDSPEEARAKKYGKKDDDKDRALGSKKVTRQERLGFDDYE